MGSFFQFGKLLGTAVLGPLVLTAVGCGSVPTTDGPVPASKFDLSHWNITLPADDNNDKKVDTVKVKEIQSYAHPDFFYLDDQGHMVFTAPNKALTTANSSNTRSELRYMLRGSNTRIGTKAPGNNFAIAANPHAAEFGSVGGRMEATLRVNHVARRAGNPNRNPAYSVVVGQIHAGNYSPPVEGFGWGNEPLKIYYKKFPDQDTGSVFWTYERNLPKKDPNRTDIAYPVWGNTWENPADPGAEGLALGEEFSYVVDVKGNVMNLTFTAAGRETAKRVPITNAVLKRTLAFGMQVVPVRVTGQQTKRMETMPV